MLILENICEHSSTLRVIYLINNIIEILFIAVPAALVLVLSIDIAKNVLSKDDNEIKETLKKGIKRIIYASLLFFVPLIVKLSFSFLGNIGVKYLDCFSMATKENIEKYEAKEEKEKEQRAKERQEELEQQKKIKEEEQAKEQAEAIKKREENRKKSSVTNGASAVNKKALELAWPVGTSKSKWVYPSGSATSAFAAAYKQYPYRTKSCSSKYGCGPMKGASCDRYVGAVVWASGYDTDFNANLGFSKGQQGYHMAHSSKWQKINYSFKSSDLKAGDIVIYGRKSGGGHILIIVEVNGKLAIAEAGLNSSYGHITTSLSKILNSSKFSRIEVYRATS